MSGASNFKLLQKPREHIQAQCINPNGLSLLQMAVVNLLFILHEHRHQLDNYKTHEEALTLLNELYYIGGDDVKANFIHFLEQKYDNTDPFVVVITALMAIFDFDYNPDTDHERQRYVVFKQGMNENYYTTAMNSLNYLMNNNHLLPVYLPVCSLPPQLPNAWAQKERELMDDVDMAHALTAEEHVTAAQSSADLPLPLQYYKKVFRKGIVKLRPLFEHAKTNPGAIVCYDGIKVSFENALRKVQELFKERSPVKSAARKRSRSPVIGPRRSDRLEKKGGHKIKTVRRHNSNKHKKTKSRRV